MDFGKKLSYLILESDLNQDDIAKELFVSPKTLSAWKRFKFGKLPNAENLFKIAKFFKVTPEYLQDNTSGYPPRVSDRLPDKPSEPIYKETDRPRRAEFMLLPLYGEIVGGPPEKAEGNLEGHYEVLAHLWGKDRYVLRVRGDSMYPDIRENDLILVENLINDSTPIENFHNKICTVLYHSESALKKINITKEGIELRPINPHYPAILVKKHEDFSVQGVVLKLVERDL